MYTLFASIYRRLPLKLSLLAGILLASACSTTLNTRITTFKDQAVNSDTIGSVYIRPLEADKAGSLEFSWYAEPLASRMEALGFRVVKDPDADYLLDLEYGVNRRGADDKNSNTVFISGGFGSFRRGSSVGVVLDNDDDTYEYERVVNLRLTKRAGDANTKGLSLLEVSAVSVGRCELLLPIYPAMLDAIFTDLYRANGSTVRVKSSLDADHCKVPRP